MHALVRERVGVRVELEITYDGNEPGLSEHRLSLSSFAEPLRLLLSALQRTASGIVSQALEDPDYGSRGGKLATDAKLLDLELEGVWDGCARPKFLCVARAPTARAQPILPHVELAPLQRDLAATALQRLLEDIDAERSGRLRNASARRYLEAIPAGVTRQRYTATRDGVVLANVEFGTAMLPETPQPLPRLTKLSGTITSVGFEPGATFVALKVGNRSLKCVATAEQVDGAITLRGLPVVAAILSAGDKQTLIWIQSVQDHPRPPPIEETIRHLREDWHETLARLAK